MRNRRKVTAKDMELLPDPIWIEQDNMLEPSPFFLNWWQQVTQIRFRDKERWLDVAKELGYVSRNGDPIGFEYDRSPARASLGIRENMPLLKSEGNAESYQALRKLLLKERGT